VVRGNLLVSNEDLEKTNDLSKRNTLVSLPVYNVVLRFDVDNEILVSILAFVVDLGFTGVSHDGG
jgi:hypothetical protein